MTTSKDKLIIATIEAIYTNGLHSVTTAKIAKEANLSEAMIYKHFGNKDHMIIESFMFIKIELNNFVLSKLTGSRDMRVESYNIWLANLDFFLNNPKYLRVLTQFEHSNYMTDSIKNDCLALIDVLISFFESGISKGIFKNMHIDIATALFFSPILTIAESIIDGRLERSKEVLDLVFHSTLDALTV